MLVAWIGLLSRVNGAHAALAFPSIANHVQGARIDVAPSRADGSLATWRVEVADAELFGVAGLRSSGVRASGRAGPWIVNAAAVQVSSPVGDHARAVLEAGFVIRGAWQGAVRAGAERLALDATRPLHARVTGLASRIDAGRVSLLADVEWIEGDGADDTSIVLASRFRAGAARLTGTLRIDGDRFVGAGISLCARVHRDLDVLAGYDDGAGSLRAAVIIHAGMLDMATGVWQHPVLGLSHGVSVACAR